MGILWDDKVSSEHALLPPLSLPIPRFYHSVWTHSIFFCDNGGRLWQYHFIYTSQHGVQLWYNAGPMSWILAQRCDNFALTLTFPCWRWQWRSFVTILFWHPRYKQNFAWPTSRQELCPCLLPPHPAIRMKSRTLNRSWFNVVPRSATLSQH